MSSIVTKEKLLRGEWRAKLKAFAQTGEFQKDAK